jgi:hypothetical protein
MTARAIFLIPVAFSAIEHLFSGRKSAREQEVAERRPLDSRFSRKKVYSVAVGNEQHIRSYLGSRCIRIDPLLLVNGWGY